MSPRVKRLDIYQRYFDGTIYDGRVGFLESTDVPLSERAPCVQYPAVRNAAVSFATMCLGDNRFPLITSMTSEDDAAFDKRFGLNPNDSKAIDAGIGKISEQTRLPTVSQQLLEAALSTGTVATLACISKGRLKISLLDAKCCNPTFNEDSPEQVDSLEITYRYITRDTWDPQARQYKTQAWQYRRVIDDKYDTCYAPVEIKDESEFPVPTVEKTKYKHSFGFCPVVWYKFLAPVSSSGDIDGKPIHWGLLPLIDTINFSLSQRHRAALYCGDPQIVECGVEDEDVRMPMGRASDAKQQTADLSGYNLPLTGSKSGGMSMKRRKGAGTVWRYTSGDAKVHMLTLPGDALKALDQDGQDNIAKLREALGHIHIDPTTLTGSGDISGKTLAFIFATQIAKCNRIREDFGRMCLLPILNMLFRIVLKAGDGLYLAGSDKLRTILTRFEQQVGTSKDMQWFDPSLKLQWGDYFETSDVDESTRIANALAAQNGNLVTTATAVQHIKPIFSDIQNVPQYLLQLQKEADEKMAKAQEQLAAQAKVGANGAMSAKPAAGGPVPAKPNASTAPRSASPAA